MKSLKRWCVRRKVKKRREEFMRTIKRLGLLKIQDRLDDYTIFSGVGLEKKNEKMCRMARKAIYALGGTP